MATTEAPPLESLDGPALLARLRAEGIRTKAVVDASGLSYGHVSRILHGHEIPGWYASAHIRRALCALGLSEEGGVQRA